MKIEEWLSEHKKLVAVILLALIIFVWYDRFGLQIIPGPEGVSCTLYGVQANGGIRVGGKTANAYHPGMSVVGRVYPGSWIAYHDYDDKDVWTSEILPRRIGYVWERTDPSTPVIKAVIVNRETGELLEGINLQIRIEQPTFQEVNMHGDPIGRSPTQIDWYSFETDKTESGDTVTWKHYEVYVVPVDFVIELTIRPVKDLDVGDFQSFDLWFVLDTNVWLNAFTYDQMRLLNEPPPEGAQITAYSFRGAFPIWAWVGAWDPWVVTGRDGDPEKEYDLADLSPEERSELETHLQLQPSFAGSKITLYKEPGYIYDRIFAEDIIRNPTLLESTITSSISNLPDPRFAQTVYFYLTLINFGALKREGGWWVTYWHKEYYPTAYMRVRTLYAIYGEWVYAWTKEEAEEHGYEWRNQTSIIIDNPSIWDKFFSGFGAWFTSPLTQFWLLLTIFAIIVILVTIFNPGVWAGLISLFRRRKE